MPNFILNLATSIPYHQYAHTLTCLQVPLLNASSVLSVPHHSLVRYRCMIQDQFDPEFYFQVYHTRSSTSSSSSGQGEPVSIQ